MRPFRSVQIYRQTMKPRVFTLFPMRLPSAEFPIIRRQVEYHSRRTFLVVKLADSFTARLHKRSKMPGLSEQAAAKTQIPVAD